MGAHHKKINEVLSEIKKIVVGQDYMVNRLLLGLFIQGHILLEGVPGLAKTLTVKTVSNVLRLNFKRIQFTPDLLPSDVIGTMIFNQKNSKFEVKKGPVFSNILLADEVNREQTEDEIREYNEKQAPSLLFWILNLWITFQLLLTV